MNYIIKTNRKIKTEDFIKVRDTTNFIKYTYKDMKKSLKNSLHVIGVYNENNNPIGMVRIVGDGVTSYFIKDFIVIPEYQKNGVGKIIMNEINKYFIKNAIDKAYIGLMSTKNAETFYEKNGFIKRPNNDLGSGMVKFHEK